MDVRHDRNRHLPFDLRNRLRRLHRRNRHPDNITSGLLETMDLRSRRAGVLRLCIRHRLHGHRIAAADRNVPNGNFPRFHRILLVSFLRS